MFQPLRFRRPQCMHIAYAVLCSPHIPAHTTGVPSPRVSALAPVPPACTGQPFTPPVRHANSYHAKHHSHFEKLHRVICRYSASGSGQLENERISDLGNYLLCSLFPPCECHKLADEGSGLWNNNVIAYTDALPCVYAMPRAALLVCNSSLLFLGA